MSPGERSAYITCPRYKHHPRKHVTVCRGCRWRGRCAAYRAWRQPQLPLVFRRER